MIRFDLRTCYPKRSASVLLVFATAILASPLIAAETESGENWDLCPTQATEYRDAPLFDLEATPVDFSADKARVDQAGTSIFSGSVSVRRNEQTMSANSVRYNDREAYAELDGDVVYQDPNWIIHAPYGEYDIDSGRIEVDDADFEFSSRHARGGAGQIVREGDGVVELREARYTTCEEGDEFWVLSGDKIRLDGDAGVGSARDVVLKLKGVPIFYTPYLSFPLNDDRKSGFLAPSAGTSSESGLDIEIPYYFNIAPDKDLTLTPRILANRGLQFRSEANHLGEAREGNIGLEYLRDEQYNDDRYAITLEHDQHWLDERLSADVNYNRVSDRDYLDDLSNSLSVSSTTHLERRGDLRFDAGAWDLLARLQNYQTLDEDIAPIDRPYERVPQLIADGRYDDQPLGLGYHLRGEWGRFEHDDNIDGERYDLSFAVNRPIEGPGYFVRPQVEVQHTGYQLDDAVLNDEDNPNRTLPIASLDTGLIFENWGEKHLKTIEPRLYYLYIPFEDQDDLPVFDTGLYDYNFNQLFRDDRFNGIDRIGDAHQLTSAITSRLIQADSGFERANLSVGQIYYIEDQRVTLPGSAPDQGNQADYVAELNYYLNKRLSTSGSVIWDPEEDRVERGVAGIRYRDDGGRIINLSYRRRQDIDIRQSDLAFALPLTAQWRAVGRLNYDFEASQDLESFAGLEYESCCFKLRVLGRRYINDDEDEHNTGIFFQLVLKGLTSLGAPLDKQLEKGILGYDGDWGY